MSNPKTPFEDVPLQDFLGVIDVNVTACFLCAQEAFRIMKSQEPKGGR
jgi:NAD(P)-dependent dehydrogenase (short-subunit alcohol dehydrogenase family)